VKDGTGARIIDGKPLAESIKYGRYGQDDGVYRYNVLKHHWHHLAALTNAAASHQEANADLVWENTLGPRRAFLVTKKTVVAGTELLWFYSPVLVGEDTMK
jgi:hypothetical protein